MQFFRSSLSRLAIATTLMGASLAIAPQLVEARQPCGSFTINWGGTIRQEDILKCAVEYNTGARHFDRYYLEIKKSKITDSFKVFEISFPEDFDGKINAEKIRVLVNGEEVALVPSETLWDPVATPIATNVERTSEIVNNIESAAKPPSNDISNGEGDLVFINGELVFLTAAELAAQQATNSRPSNTTSVPSPNAVEPPPTEAEPTTHSLFITLAEPLEEDSEVEIILDEVRNPSNGGMYLVTAFARSQGAALPSRLGAWFIDVDF